MSVSMTMQDRVVIAVDPHKASWTAAAVDASLQPLATVRVPVSRDGYRALRRFARRWPKAGWAIEGAAGFGAPLTTRLHSDEIEVIDVPAKLAARAFCCFTWINGVDLRYGSMADQGRTGREDSSSRLWRPARAPGTHAKQGPSTGHSAAGLRQGGEMSPDAEATFHRASCTLGNQVVGASDGPPFRQERRPTRLCRTPGAVAVCLPKQALCELGDRVLGGDRIVEHR